MMPTNGGPARYAQGGECNPRIGHGLVAAIGARLEMYAPDAAAMRLGVDISCRSPFRPSAVSTSSASTPAPNRLEHARARNAGGEIIAPIEMMHFSPVCQRFHRAIGGAGVTTISDAPLHQGLLGIDRGISPRFSRSC